MIRTWRDAERAARNIMRDLGHTDARLTSDGSDGGIDVVSSSAFAQVKHEMSKTGSPALQRLVGAGAVRPERDLIFFSSAGYSTPALDYANRVGVALFRLNPDETATPVNRLAEELAAAAPYQLLPVDAGPAHEPPPAATKSPPAASGFSTFIVFAFVAFCLWMPTLAGISDLGVAAFVGTAALVSSGVAVWAFVRWVRWLNGRMRRRRSTGDVHSVDTEVS